MSSFDQFIWCLCWISVSWFNKKKKWRGGHRTLVFIYFLSCVICYLLFFHFLKFSFLNFLTRKGEGREGNMRMPKGSQWSPLERAAGQDSVSWNLQDNFFHKIVWPMKEILTILMILMKMWIIFCGCWVPKLEDPWRLISLRETATTTQAKLKKNHQSSCYLTLHPSFNACAQKWEMWTKFNRNHQPNNHKLELTGAKIISLDIPLWS